MGDNESGHPGHEADGDHPPEVEAGHEHHDEWSSSDHVDFDDDTPVSGHDLDDMRDGDDTGDFDGDLDDPGVDPLPADADDALEPVDGPDPFDGGVNDVHLEPDTAGLFSPDLLDAVLERIPGVDAASFTDRIAEFVDDDDFGLGLDTRAVTRLLDTSGVESIIEYGTTDHIEQRVGSGQVVLVGGTEHQWTVTFIDGDVLELHDEAGRSRTIDREAFDELWEQSTTEIIEIRPDTDTLGPIRFDDDMRIAVLPMTIDD